MFDWKLKIQTKRKEVNFELRKNLIEKMIDGEPNMAMREFMKGPASSKRNALEFLPSKGVLETVEESRCRNGDSDNLWFTRKTMSICDEVQATQT